MTFPWQPFGSVVLTGAGNPEGVVVAPPGTFYLGAADKDVEVYWQLWEPITP